MSRKVRVAGCRIGLALAALLLLRGPLQARQQVPDQVLDIFDESCAFKGCHAGLPPAAGMTLTEEAVLNNVVNVKSVADPQIVRVKPGDPGASYLILKLTGGEGMQGERMPKGSQPLPDDKIKVISDWIAGLPPAGAPAHPADEPQVEAFPGWTVANVPTAMTLPKGAFMYRIAHRFNNPVDSGFDELFGLDGGAAMLTQIAFPLSSALTVSFERSKINATFEFAAKYRLLHQSTAGRAPVSLALMAGVDWASARDVPDPAAPQGDFLGRTAGERFAFFAQLPVSKAVGKRLSLLVTPGLLLNGNLAKTDENLLLTLGLAGKVNLSRKYALFAEYVPILSGTEDAAVVGALTTNAEGRQIFYDTFTTGIEINVGGHVFHVFVTNSLGSTTNQYSSGGNFDFFDGDMRIGFNIYRLLNYPF